jgi:hypothetical protein
VSPALSVEAAKKFTGIIPIIQSHSKLSGYAKSIIEKCMGQQNDLLPRPNPFPPECGRQTARKTDVYGKYLCGVGTRLNWE